MLYLWNTKDVALVVTIKTGEILLCPGAACYLGPHICTVQPWRLLSCSHIHIKTLAIIAYVFQTLLLLMPSYMHSTTLSVLTHVPHIRNYYLCHPYVYSTTLSLRWNGCSVPSCDERWVKYFSHIVPHDQRLPWVSEEAVDFWTVIILWKTMVTFRDKCIVQINMTGSSTLRS